MKEITINEKSKKKLQDLDKQIHQLSAYMRIIGDTILENMNEEGEYGFSPDFSKLVKKEVPKDNGNRVSK